MDKLREIYTALGYTTKDVATALGVHVATVYRWEQGKNKMTVDKLGALCNFLGLVPADLGIGAKEARCDLYLK